MATSSTYVRAFCFYAIAGTIVVIVWTTQSPTVRFAIALPCAIVGLGLFVFLRGQRVAKK